MHEGLFKLALFNMIPLKRGTQMDQREIIDYFDRRARTWDDHQHHKNQIIGAILDNACVWRGTDVLDVACGTGVLFPAYLKRGVASLTAIDISPEMVRVAQEKYRKENISIICSDAETVQIGRKFDCIVIYNAFPHFANPARLLSNLTKMLKPGGTLTVAHSMSRAHLDRHHARMAKRVSVGLMHEDDLAGLFARELQVITKISNYHMYQIVGAYWPIRREKSLSQDRWS